MCIIEKILMLNEENVSIVIVYVVGNIVVLIFKWRFL